MSGHVVILANGDFPRTPRLLRLLQEADYLVCCDGAIAPLSRAGLREPDAIVGDFDSLPSDLAERYRSLLHAEAEQETNDLAKAFRFCRRQGWLEGRKLFILGAAGRRDDHTLGNISLLFTLAADHPDTEIWTDYGRFEAVLKSGVIPCTPREQVSIFAEDPELPVTSDGLKYPLQALKLTHWWTATLNECLGDRFALDFPDGGGPLLLYRPWPEAVGPAEPPKRLPWRRIHFCGCGGVGMAGLAQIALDDGCAVSGTDLVASAQFQALKARGADVRVGHDAAALPSDTQLLVYSAAVPADNPERLVAARRGIPQCSRGQFLARLAPHFQCVVAVAGTHGKTTTTAMLAHILRETTTAPGYLVGGLVTGWPRFAAAGDWSVLATEVDESDRSQEMMLPDISLILNIDDDHSWAVGGPERLMESFRTLANHALHVIVSSQLIANKVVTENNATVFNANDVPQEVLNENCLGAHSRMDAAAALAAAVHLGVPREAALTALKSFPGVQRRLTCRYRSADGRRLYYDDYAHHPTELEAGLKALRERYPKHALVAFFQPHRPERILRYGADFARLLEHYAQHAYIVTPFLAWETAQPEATPEAIVRAANALRAGCAEAISADPKLIAARLKEILSADGGPVLAVTIGAGDIGLAAKAFVDSHGLPTQDGGTN